MDAIFGFINENAGALAAVSIIIAVAAILWPRPKAPDLSGLVTTKALNQRLRGLVTQGALKKKLKGKVGRQAFMDYLREHYQPHSYYSTAYAKVQRDLLPVMKVVHALKQTMISLLQAEQEMVAVDLRNVQDQIVVIDDDRDLQDYEARLEAFRLEETDFESEVLRLQGLQLPENPTEEQKQALALRFAGTEKDMAARLGAMSDFVAEYDDHRRELASQLDDARASLTEHRGAREKFQTASGQGHRKVLEREELRRQLKSLQATQASLKARQEALEKLDQAETPDEAEA